MNPAKLVIAATVLLGSIAMSSAGYLVRTQVESTAAQNRYTWTVRNQDQGMGLSQFAIDVPAETHVLAHTEPPPYEARPDGSAYWSMMETREAKLDPHDGREWLPAAKPGRKWLLWHAVEPPSVYQRGSAATFTLLTDAAVMPGTVTGQTTTYTPQSDPHYYVSFPGDIIGPSTLANDASPRLTKTSVQIAETQFQSVRPENSLSNGDTGQTDAAPKLSLGLHPGLTIEGAIASTYGIQFTTDPRNPNGWQGLANVTLSAAIQTWIDPEPASATQRYYRIVPGPISIP